MAAKKHVNTVVMPGDVIGKISELEPENQSKGKLIIGPGLRQERDEIKVCKPGLLRHRAPATFWIDFSSKRYIPAKDELVVGIVTNRGSESYRVDIGSDKAASLSNLAFEGATKKNRPNLQIGDLVYCRLSVANKDMEPELSCVDPTNGKSCGMGPLTGGFMFKCSLGLTRKLLQPENKLLKLLGKHFPFECSIGMNGRVWINSKTIINTIAIANAVTTSEFMTDSQISDLVNTIIHGIQG